MAVGLVAVSERAENGGPLLVAAENENIVHVAHGMGVVLGDTAPQQPGTLYVTNRRLLWLSDDDSRKGYAVDFHSLSMHAISRDPDAYPVPCIYTQIEGPEDDEHWDDIDEADGEPLETENHVETNLSEVSEMRLVPRDPNTQQEGEGEWFFNANEVLGRAVGEDQNPAVPNIGELQIQDPRFEDAEEDLEESDN